MRHEAGAGVWTELGAGGRGKGMGRAEGMVMGRSLRKGWGTGSRQRQG